MIFYSLESYFNYLKHIFTIVLSWNASTRYNVATNRL